MPKGLHRFHRSGNWHFITCSCYQRRKFLDSAGARDLFLEILEEVRAKYDPVVAGYVVMPEHFHLLMSEPRTGKLSTAMQVLKQRVSRRCIGQKPFWHTRYYDFNLFSKAKYVEKLRYIHRNPVKRGLVESPELWLWSSFREYWSGVPGKVKIGE